MLRIDHSGRRDQHELLHPIVVLARKLRGQVAAERKPHQMEPVEPELIKQFEIVHDVVVHVGERRIVTGLPEARMIGHDHLETSAHGSAKSNPSTVPAP